jgi:sterol desaturase/sphingolipid hydroxylase (fatty acid hydroxylase superfamily)
MHDAMVRFLLSPVSVIYAAGYSLWLALLLLEAGWSRLRGLGLYAWRDTLVNAVMYAGYFLINLFWVHAVFRIYTFVHAHAIVQIGIGAWHTGAGGRWWEWALLFVAEDFCFYWFHRASHRLRFFWAAHVTHHSSRFFNLSVAFRQTWTPFVAVVFWLPLPWLGFDPLMVMTMQMISLFYQLGLHTQLVPALGPLEWVFNTPQHHRLHHAVNAPYLDRNFGGILIVWDRLFGTFAAARPGEAPRYGVRPVFTSHNPLRVAFQEWWLLLRSAVTAREPRP